MVTGVWSGVGAKLPGSPANNYQRRNPQTGKLSVHAAQNLSASPGYLIRAVGLCGCKNLGFWWKFFWPAVTASDCVSLWFPY
jgi:hypothetical protein